MISFRSAALGCTELDACSSSGRHPMRTGFLMLISAFGLIASAIAPATGAALLGGEAVPAELSSAPTADAASANKDFGEVTVTGRRSELEPRVSAFVQQISGSYYDDGLARWIKPVCPRVTGLPQQEDEFILGRVSDIARAAGITLAGDKCRANLYILVTDQPTELLRGMEKRGHTFGNSPTNLVDSFISTPRAVRVWYDTNVISPEGQPLVQMSFPAVEREPGNGNNAGMMLNPSTGAQLRDGNSAKNASGATNAWSQSTHLSANVVSEIYRDIVVVDTTRLQALSREQIVDYIGMVALAEIKTGAHPDDAPTILKLLDDAPQDALTGISDWDRAFLKSLYSTEQKSKLQGALIAREMVRELVH
jgi:hypothetical protein